MIFAIAIVIATIELAFSSLKCLVAVSKGVTPGTVTVTGRLAILSLNLPVISAAKGYLDSCQHFDVHNLDGDSGREVRMYAECRSINGDYVQTNLDLNTCFSWVDCKLSYPGSDFSSTCNECDNPWNGEDQFGTRFACKGYCDQRDENGLQQSISDTNLNEYIGNNNGSLHCTPSF